MKPKGLIATMVAMPILIAATLGIAGVWLTGEMLVLPLVGLAAAIVGGALVVYFNWRTTFRRWILSEADDKKARSVARTGVETGTVSPSS